MSIIQSVTALFRSPDAAVMVNQAVQASDLAARQGQASLQRDAARREEMIVDALPTQPSNIIGQRPEDEKHPSHRGHPEGDSAESDAPAPDSPHRLDIRV